MKDREGSIGRARQVFVNFARRITHPSRPVTETPHPVSPRENLGGKRMWEILNVIPITELNSLTPAERAEFERRSAQRLQAQIEFQNSLNQTVGEFFAGPKDKPRDTSS